MTSYGQAFVCITSICYVSICYFYSILFVFTCTILSVVLCCSVGGACDLRLSSTYLHCSSVQMTIKALNLEIIQSECHVSPQESPPSSLLTDDLFLRRHSEAQLYGGVSLSLFPQQRPQGAPQDEGDAAVRHHSIACRLRGFAVRRQLHQQRQEGGEVRLQPGASEGGDEDNAGLRKRRRSDDGETAHIETIQNRWTVGETLNVLFQHESNMLTKVPQL